MDAHERIRVLAKAHRMPLARLARLSGVAPNTLHKPRDGIEFRTVERVLNVLGYEIIVVPRDANKLLSLQLPPGTESRNTLSGDQK